MRLTPRLQAIADFVEPGARIADVGTDHAYIPIYLIRNKKIEYAMASDINEGPIKKAEKNLERYGIQNKVRLCTADGTKGIRPREVDTLIVAGMGGELIAQILLENIPQGIQRMILQPMANAHEVRSALCDVGYIISKEKLVREKNKIYQIICAIPGTSEKQEKEEYRFSTHLFDDPLYSEFLRKEQEKVNRSIHQLSFSVDRSLQLQFENRKRRIGRELAVLEDYQRKTDTEDS